MERGRERERKREERIHVHENKISYHGCTRYYMLGHKFVP